MLVVQVWDLPNFWCLALAPEQISRAFFSVIFTPMLLSGRQFQSVRTGMSDTDTHPPRKKRGAVKMTANMAWGFIVVFLSGFPGCVTKQAQAPGACRIATDVNSPFISR